MNPGTSNTSATAGTTSFNRSSQAQGAAAPTAQSQSFPPLKQRPVYCVYDTSFVYDKKKRKAGVYFHDAVEQPDPKDKNKKITVVTDTWVCSVLRVLAITRNLAAPIIVTSSNTFPTAKPRNDPPS